MLGTEKCRSPKPIEIILPIVTSIFAKESFSGFECIIFVIRYTIVKGPGVGS